MGIYISKGAQNLSESPSYSAAPSNKRYRRSANEILREFECSVCHKTYGSEGSLNQHIKLKHQKIK